MLLLLLRLLLLQILLSLLNVLGLLSPLGPYFGVIHSLGPSQDTVVCLIAGDSFTKRLLRVGEGS